MPGQSDLPDHGVLRLTMGRADSGLTIRIHTQKDAIGHLIRPKAI